MIFRPPENQQLSVLPVRPAGFESGLRNGRTRPLIRGPLRLLKGAFSIPLDQDFLGGIADNPQNQRPGRVDPFHVDRLRFPSQYFQFLVGSFNHHR